MESEFNAVCMEMTRTHIGDATEMGAWVFPSALLGLRSVFLLLLFLLILLGCCKSYIPLPQPFSRW